MAQRKITQIWICEKCLCCVNKNIPIWPKQYNCLVFHDHEILMLENNARCTLLISVSVTYYIHIDM